MPARTPSPTSWSGYVPTISTGPPTRASSMPSSISTAAGDPPTPSPSPPNSTAEACCAERRAPLSAHADRHRAHRRQRWLLRRHRRRKAVLRRLVGRRHPCRAVRLLPAPTALMSTKSSIAPRPKSTTSPGNARPRTSPARRPPPTHHGRDRRHRLHGGSAHGVPTGYRDPTNSPTDCSWDR